MVWYLKTTLQLPNMTNIISCVKSRHMKKKKTVNENKPVNDGTSSGGARPLTSNSKEQSLK